MFQGLSELDAEAMHKLHLEEDAVIESRAAAAAASPQVTGEPIPDADGMKITYQRPPKRPDPRENLKGAVREASQKSEWGTGDEGYKRPKTSADKLRYELPVYPCVLRDTKLVLLRTGKTYLTR